MKKFFYLLMMGCALSQMSAQSLSETFEQSADIPDGWIAKSTSDRYKWQVISYKNDPSLTLLKGFHHGGNNLIRARSGYTMPSANPPIPSTDSWLISPQVAVTSGDYLHFMLGYNSSFNGNAFITEPFRTTFEILISEGNTNPSEFKTSIFKIVPINVSPWNNYCIDLSAFAGKKIHIAFHEYGKCKEMPFLTNSLFLDNIEINKIKTSDLSTLEITSPVSGCAVSQKVEVSVCNVGDAVETYTMCYQINNEEVVKEVVNKSLNKNDTITHIFKKDALLKQGIEYRVKAWVECTKDSNTDNDTISTPSSILINKEMDFPYTMSDENALTTFRSIGSVHLGKQTYGWEYVDNAQLGGKAWCWTFFKRVNSHLLSDCILLPKGKIKMLFDYMTYVEANLEIHIIDKFGKETTLAGSQTLPVAEKLTHKGMVLDIPQAGLYTISIAPDRKYQGQLFLKNIKLTDIYEDLSIVELTNPIYNAYPQESEIAVSAMLLNSGGNTAKDFKVCYRLDDKDIVKETIESLASGANLNYTFKTGIKLKGIGNHTLNVWCELLGDKDTSNDSTATQMYVYAPENFPFKSGFEEKNSHNAEWIIYNPDKDLLKWGFEEAISNGINYAKEGKRVAYISSVMGVEHNDWLISPEIKMLKGKARVSFYYVTKMKSNSPNAKCNLVIYLSKSSDTKEILKSNPIAVATLTNRNVNLMTQGYAPLDIPEDGNYYICIHNTGTGHDVMLDDFRVDNGNDLCMVDLLNSAKSGFNLKENTITIKLANHGANAVRKIPVSYEVNDGQECQEVYDGTINPGDTLSYSFNKKCKLQNSNFTYVVKGKANIPSDVDHFNNQWQGLPFTYFANDQIPYTADFDTSTSRIKWTLNPLWITGDGFISPNAAYNGTGALTHRSTAKNEEGDWAFSGCVSIKKGSYDFSFFYRTLMNMTQADVYGQNFEIFLGDSPDAASMKQSICKMDNLINANKAYDKFLTTLEVPQDGNYYLGIKCTTKNERGCIFLDDFKISPKVTTGITLYTPFNSNFAKNSDKWYRYNPSKVYQQWVLKEGGNESFMQVQRASFDYTDSPTELPGFFVAPAFYFEKGDVIKFSFDYKIGIDHPEMLETEEKDRINIRLYLADQDTPKAFTRRLGIGKNWEDKKETVSGEFAIDKDGIYYIGFLAEGQKKSKKGIVITTYDLYNLKLRDERRESISSIQAEGTMSYDNHTITILKDYKEATVYTMNGQVVAQYRSEHTIQTDQWPCGVYILVVKRANGQYVHKFEVK